VTIDTFNPRGEWGIDNQLIGDDNENIEDTITNAGFEYYDSFGNDWGSFQVRIRHWEGAQDTLDDFLVTMDTNNYFRMIYCPSFPAVVLLLKQLEPWFRMSQSTFLYMIVEEFKELLIDNGIQGPLAECLMERRSKWRAQKERDKEDREAARAQARPVL